MPTIRATSNQVQPVAAPANGVTLQAAKIAGTDNVRVTWTITGTPSSANGTLFRRNVTAGESFSTNHSVTLSNNAFDDNASAASSFLGPKFIAGNVYEYALDVPFA